MGRWQSMSRRRRRRYIAAAVAAIIATVIGAGTAVIVGGSDDQIPPPPPSTGDAVLAHLLSTRDVGGMPSSADFCSGADHCWSFEADGDQADRGEGSWTLTKSGTLSPSRAGIPLYAGSSLDFTTQKAVFFNASTTRIV